MDSSTPKITDDIFSSEEKILGLLVTVRNAALSPEEKAVIRDLLLDYAGSTDEKKRNELKEQIKQRLPNQNADHKTVASVTKSPTAPAAVSLGRSRPVPSFANDSNRVAPVKIKETKIEPPIKPTIKEAEKPTEKIAVKTMTSETVSPIAPNLPIETKVEKVVEPTPKAEPVTDIAVNQDAKARINEIKHDVNERVGNPINLINADDVIGREYMTALLDAMKAVNAGSSSHSKPMDRLEAAYKKVNELLSTRDIIPTKKIKVSSETETPKTPIVEKAPEIQTSSILSGMPPREKSGSLNIPKVETVSPLTTPVRAPEANKTTTPIPSVEAPTDKLIPVSAATSLPEKIETVRKKSIEREAEASRQVTNLEDEKVTAGLKQLLSEWKLFKGKSWFGGGASGMDHPMYKQLSTLPMAAVISGRFEGATPETRYLISDYVNGWRYEQGITYDTGETFEHYLRRVILQILGKQKPTTPSGSK